MENKIKKYLLVIAMFIGSVGATFAQPQPPPPIGLANPAGPTLSCPISDGYYILIALALIYGAYKIWQTRKAEQIG